ncbi:MAG: S49 family peptidase [Phycisphaerales bacterium]|nr:S49 family peptidase [Phycisphaerales bacterium]
MSDRSARRCSVAVVSCIALAFGAGLAFPAQLLGAPTIGFIELDGPINSRRPHTSPFMLGGGKGMHMSQLRAAFKKASDNADLKGVVIRIKDAELTRSNIDELGDLMDAFRKTGKKIHVYSENYSTPEMLLACHADEVIIEKGGGVMIPGIYVEEMYLADMLRWVGVTPDFVQVGDYKGASEMMANAKPSEAWNQNINGLLDSMYADMRSTIGTGRKLSAQQVDKALDTAWMASDEDAKRVGLVDSIVDLAELETHLSTAYSGQIEWESDLLPDPHKDLAAEMGNPFMMFSKLMEKPSYEPKRSTIAVLHIDGAIVDGESTSGGLMGGEGSVGSRTLRRALQDIESNDKIKGLVVRVDSPGGSAIASEMIWQGIKRVAAGSKVGDEVNPPKPVFISVGDMAASGGFYCLVAGDRVYVNQSSIVGSIGVVGGKMTLAGVMEKLKINTVSRSRGPRASMFASMTPWTEAEKGLVRQKMTETYDLFTKRVTSGRPGIDLKQTAEGRLFTGAKAVELKMADQIGTLDDAIGDLASKIGLKDGGYDVMDYPAPKSLQEALEEIMGQFGASAHAPGASMIAGPGLGSGIVSTIRATAVELLGPAAGRQITSSLDAMLQMRREPVILTSPRVLIFGW